VRTGNTVEPLGSPLLDHAVDPPDARRRLLPDVTAEKVEETPLPQEKVPPETPQLPFEDVRVKLEPDPASVYVASVCVDQVPRERRPPTNEPDSEACIVAFVGMLPGAPVVVVPVVVVVVVAVPEETLVAVVPPDFGGYVIPLEGQEPASGALMATNTPSITEPFKL